jgi:hypothetical protein
LTLGQARADFAPTAAIGTEADSGEAPRGHQAR